jgi:hypothetical protein
MLRAGLIWLAGIGAVQSQELEPRRWSHVPIDTNYLAVAYARSSGDIFFDPVLRVEDGTVEIDTFVAAYLRSFDLAGKTARFDIRLPYQQARWEGLLDGEPASVAREGAGDPRFRLSVNFLGAPALKGRRFREYRSARPTNTIAGAALAITVPLGQYKEDKLLNLGGNRFVIQPQAGVVHMRGPWSYELTGSAFFFTGNDEFFDGNTREQEPIFLVQGHVVRTFSHGIWASLSAGYDWGGESRVNGEEKDDSRSDFLFALSAGMPVSTTSAVKVAFLRGRTRQETGSDTTGFAVAYTRKF